MKRLIHDCDNTMGVPGCDVDDGLANLYLLGRRDAEILGITTVFGNSDLRTVHESTSGLIDSLGKNDIPVLKGSANREQLKSEAASFIVDTVNSDIGHVSILATGPLTNLRAAHLIDPGILEKVDEIVIMGGTTEPLVINGRLLKELNLTCDPLATECVLRNGKNVSVITGNACLDAFFARSDFEARLSAGRSDSIERIRQACSPWFERMRNEFGVAGFYNWDVVAAVRLMEPQLFTEIPTPVYLGVESLAFGALDTAKDAGENARVINLPRIADVGGLVNGVYSSWLRLP